MQDWQLSLMPVWQKKKHTSSALVDNNKCWNAMTTGNKWHIATQIPLLTTAHIYMSWHLELNHVSTHKIHCRQELYIQVGTSKATVSLNQFIMTPVLSTESLGFTISRPDWSGWQKIVWCIYNTVSFLQFLIVRQQTLDSSPMRASYGMSFVSSISGLYSATLTTMLYQCCG